MCLIIYVFICVLFAFVGDAVLTHFTDSWPSSAQALIIYYVHLNIKQSYSTNDCKNYFIGKTLNLISCICRRQPVINLLGKKQKKNCIKTINFALG